MTGFLFVIATGCGIILLEMTTDPVELWATPLSRSRIEKDFFDSNFGPFYRIEQIIIESKLIGPSELIDGEYIEFGSAFNKAFMLDVLELQKGIESMFDSDHKSLIFKRI